MFSIYNINQKYKGKSCIDYLTASDIKRNDYVSNFYKQHPSLMRDSAMAYQMLLYNKDITEEDREIFTNRLNEIRNQEQIKMKDIYNEFKKRLHEEEQEILDEERKVEMDNYIDKDKDIHEVEIK